LVSATPSDAITNSVFELRKLLRQIGPSEIFARHVHPDLADEVIELSKYFRVASHHPSDDVLLYHASIGEPSVYEFITQRRERLVLVYHNIAPAAAFEPYDPAFAQLLTDGRHNLAALKDQVTMALCDSEYNAAELVALGYADVRVSRLIVDPRALVDMASDEETTEHVNIAVEGPMALFVGQLLPHKRVDLLVEAFHILSTYLLPEANLVIAGSPRLPRFAAAFEQQIAELGLSRIRLTGAIPARELRSLYQRADLWVTASDHEGFLVPLLEAMSFEVPIVARGTAAIPETLGGAGLLLDPSDGPLMMAEAWCEVIDNESLRADLIARGKSRLDDFTPESARVQVLEHLASIL